MAEDSGNAKDDRATKDAELAANLATVQGARLARVSIIVTLIFSIIAVIFSLLSYINSQEQSTNAQQQTNNAQQQELVTIVSNIAQQNVNQLESGTTSSVSVGAQAQISLTTLAEAQAASVLMKTLPSYDVSSGERYLTGIALEQGDDYEPAIQMLISAAEEASDPRTTANSWRAVASTYYALGLNSYAEQAIKKAENSFDEPGIGVTQVSKDYNLAQTELYDASYQARINCSYALTEWGEAGAIILHDPHIVNATINIDRADAKAGLTSYCHASAELLNPAVP